ncbi:MAG TPA: hypothetical protein VGQ62_12170, partial [Chloroflexota bacterium]|nr:hypothetical protein [Chloroflexota bacterium]
MSPSSKKIEDRTLAIGLVLLLALTVIAYAPFVGTGFAATDSLPLVETSRFSSIAEAAQHFLQPVMAGTRFTAGELVYRPLVSVTFGIDYLVWGLNAAGYHVTNLLLHICGVVGVVVLLVQLGLRAWSALVGATLFALHPLVVASVPVIARRDSILPVVTIVAGAALLISSDHASGSRRLGLLLGSLVLTAAALLSKESAFAAVFLVAMLFVASRLARGDRPRVVLRRSWVLIPLFVLTAVVFVVRLMLLRGLGGGSELATLLFVDMDQYSQTLGAFTRDLAWVIASLASSTREVWPRGAALVVVCLLVASLALPRRYGWLLLSGVLWVVAFGFFAALLKISTIAWLAYFALVGLSLVVAAGLEGAACQIKKARGRVRAIN